MEKTPPNEREIRDNLGRLLTHTSFVRSPQLIEFLKYIVEAKLQGEEARLKAYTIATDVFRRGSDFDPQKDSIVRVQAGRLRKLLDEIYAENASDLTVRFNLPTGRYVPAFAWNENRTTSSPISNRFDDDSAPVAAQIPEATEISAADAEPTSRGQAGWVVAGATVAVFLLLAVSLAIWLVRGGAMAPPESAALRRPVLMVDRFSGDDVVLNGRAQFTGPLIDALLSFRTLEVRAQDGDMDASSEPGRLIYRLSGTISLRNNGVDVTTRVTDVASSEIVWSDQFYRPAIGESEGVALRTLTRRIAAELGAVRGPILMHARSALPDDLTGRTDLTPYTCRHALEDAKGAGRAAETAIARDCYASLLMSRPETEEARVVLSALRAFDVWRAASPADNLAAALTLETSEALDALGQTRESSLAHEMMGRLYWVTDDIDEARAEFVQALQINPGNIDARAALGIMDVFSGERSGQLDVEEALSQTSNPPAWFYTVRVLDDLRRANYASAVRYAQILMQDDPELALTVLVAAAPGAARADLVERYAPEVLSQPQFQAQGILPRLSVRIHDPDILNDLRLGLTRAGLGPDRLDRPFEPIRTTPAPAQ